VDSPAPFRIRCGILAGLAVAALAGPVAAADAVPDWLPPRTLEADIRISCESSDSCTSVARPGLLMASDGGVLALWGTDGPPSALVSSYRPPGGDWGEPVTVAEGALFIGGGVDRDGDATVLFWRQLGPGSNTMEVVHRPAGGPFGPPEVLAGPAADIPGFSSIAVNEEGAAIAAYVRGSRLEARYRPAGGGFGPAEFVSASGGSAGRPDVAIDAAGNALAAWGHSNAGTAIQADYRPAGGSFDSSPETLSGTGVQSTPVVDFDAAGDAVIVWHRQSGSDHFVERAFWTKGAMTFTPAMQISAIGAAAPDLAVGPNGEAVAVWIRASAIEAAVRAPGSEFGSPEPISGTIASPVRIKMNRAGQAIVVWSRFADGTRRLEARPRPPGGPFGAVDEIDELPNNGIFASPGIDAEGNAAVPFTERNAPTSSPRVEDMKVAGFDAAPPRIGALQIPAVGAPGEALPFSAGVLDVWSPFATSWSFGDGETATGAAVEHAYAVPGSYGVGVTATDALGNSSAAEGTVAITLPADLVDPTVAGLSMLRRRFAVSGESTPVELAQAARRRRVKKGSAFRFRLSESARVEIRIERRAAGRRVGRRCVKPRRRHRKRRRCTRYVRRGVLKRTGVQGRNRVKFSGRIGRRALRPGRYRASVIATDAAGNASSPARISFRIVR
jgi:hypothetical protein